MVGLVVDGDVGNDGETGEHHGARQQQGPPVVGVFQHRLQRVKHLSPLCLCQVRIQTRQAVGGQATHPCAQHRQGNEGAVPAAMVGQQQARRHTGHAGQGKRRHHKAGGAAAPGKRDDVANHGLRHGRQDAAKQARGHTRRHQPAIGRGQGAAQSGQAKQQVQPQQQALAFKPIDERGGQQARQAR